MTGRGPNYSTEDVRGLVEGYAELREAKDVTRRGLRILFWLADLEQALEQLYADYWEVVLLHGLIGLTQADTGQLLQISQQAVAKRYRHGLEDTYYYINGGTD